MEKITFKDFRVAESVFKINNSFDSDRVDEIPYDISIETQLTHIEDGIVVVSITVLIFKDSLEKNYPFEIMVKIEGQFETHNDQSNIDDSELEKMYIHKGLQELFPHLRSYILNLTSMAGYPPLTLPAIDYTSLEKID